MTLVGKQNHHTLPHAHTSPHWSLAEDALQDFHASLQPQRVAGAVVRHFAALFHAHRTALLLHEQERSLPHIASVYPPDEAVWTAQWLPAHLPNLQQAAESSPQTPWLTLDMQARAERLYAFPLRLPNGDTLGMLILWTNAAHAPSEGTLPLATLLAQQATLSLHNARQHAALHDAHHLLQAAWDTTPEGLLLFDRRGRLWRFNAAAEVFFGKPLAPHLGQSVLRWLRRTNARHIKQVTGLAPQALRAYVRRCPAKIAQLARREFAQTLGKETRYLQETCSAVYGSEGRLLGWLVMWSDVTEARHQELLRQELSNMIVHDLRNPITSIASSLLMLRELLEEERDTPLLIDVVEIAHNSTAYLLNLVQSILDVARLEQGRMVLDCESHPLGDCIKDAIRSLTSQALRADVALTADIPADLPPVWADEEKIRRVLMNLLDNAIRHTPQNGHVHVSASLNTEQNRIITCVSDSGPGVPPEARTRIFEKYAQLKHDEPRGYKGVGLGLTFCKLAVEAHGGQIWVGDDPDLGGAAFCFSLPLAPFV